MDTSVEAALTRVQGLLRKGHTESEQTVVWLAPPGRKDERALGLSRQEDDALSDLEWSLNQDPRFDHLKGKPHDVAVGFLFECDDYPTRDNAPAFLAAHAKSLETAVCYIPVEYLSVPNETTVYGVRLLPPTDAYVPKPSGRYTLQPPVGSVAAIDVAGTDYGRMADRGRLTVEQALRRLRIALREHRGINDLQLRFRLGDAYSFGDGRSGWKASPETSYALGLDPDLVALAAAQPMAALSAEPRSKLDHQVDLAIRWIERAMFTGEPLVSLLYLFFALEALLGDKSAKLKGHDLALRQMMLSHVVDGGFTNPNETFFLYDAVRSAAVHGERAPDVDQDTVSSFAWLVRRTLNQYVTYARQKEFQRRSRLLKDLDEHADRAFCLDWLKANGGPAWDVYLEEAGAIGDAS